MTVVLLSGRTGQVGSELYRLLPALGRVIAPARAQMDLASADAIRKTIREASPGIIVNAAGYTAVDQAEAEPELAMRVNGVAPGVMAEEARRSGALLVHYSTDYVFDGTRAAPYVEEDEPNPLNVYGKSKLAGELAVAASGCAHLILRTSWVYSGSGANFLLTILKLARENEELRVVDDQIGSPTWARALAKATVELLQKAALARDTTGVYHLSSTEVASRYDFARAIVEIARELSRKNTGWASLRRIRTEEYPLPAVRPRHPATSKAKIKRVFGAELPDWKAQLRACLREVMQIENR